MKKRFLLVVLVSLLVSCSSKSELEDIARQDLMVIRAGLACSIDPKADECVVYEGFLASCVRDRYGRVHECSNNIAGKLIGARSIDLYWQKYDPNSDYFSGPDLKGFLAGCVNVIGWDRCYDASGNPYYGGIARHASWGRSFLNLIEIPAIMLIRSKDGLD